MAIGLLEYQAGRHGKGAVAGIARRDKTRQDQYPFGMNGAAQFGFAFDIDHFAVAQACGCGDARRLSESKLAQLQYRKAIDLAGYLTFGVDQYRAALNGFIEFFPELVQSVDFVINGCWMSLLAIWEWPLSSAQKLASVNKS